jgi:hypothetical protein
MPHGFSAASRGSFSVRWTVTPPGDDRSRILTYLDHAIRSTEEADVLPRLRALAIGWRDDLSDRWPETTPLSEFPAFSDAAPREARGRPDGSRVE